MNRQCLLVVVAVMLCCCAATASAQVVVSPYVTYYAPAPVTVGYGTVSTGLVTAYYPAAVAAPVAVPYTSYYAPVASPYVAYSPIVAAPAPCAVAPAVVPVVPVVVRTKVYVPGEPVRNFFRAITP